MAKKVAGYVLPPEATHSSEAMTFPGFPGVFSPGEPVAVDTMGGISEEEADALIAELELPLEKARADAPEPEPEPEPQPVAEPEA